MRFPLPTDTAKWFGVPVAYREQTMSDNSQDPKTIVLTGVTHGLGKALAIKFAGMGHTVIGCGRSEEALALLRGELGEPHAFDAVDITDAGTVAEWGEGILECFGPPDLLINNAGVVNKNNKSWRIDADEFDTVINVNLIGVGNVIRALVPAMVKEKRGTIMGLCSGAGHKGLKFIGPYCATKFAMEGLLKSMALELPKGMAAIGLSPPVVNTRIIQSNFGKAAEKMESPDTWAERAAPFILSLGEKESGTVQTVPSE